MNEKDIDLLLKFARLVNSKTEESIQNYISNEKRLGSVVRYKKSNLVTAIWFDVEKLSERDLRYFFKHHKESDKQFFIEYLENFYRIGFKTKKTAI